MAPSLLVVVIALAGCPIGPSKTPPTPDSPGYRAIVEKAPKPASRNACLHIGGRWRSAIGLTGHCWDIPAPDGGKACTDSSQCQSYCETVRLVQPCTKVV